MKLATRSLLLGGAALALGAGSAHAFPSIFGDWQGRYQAVSPTGDNAQCQLCHGNPNGGSPWNAYGWDVRSSFADPACDRDADQFVTNTEAFLCVETVNSDGDGSGVDNLTEILLGTQPGWVEGPFNTLYSAGGESTGNLPPETIGAVDPDGTEPPPPPPPPPPGDDDLPDWQVRERFILVRPGQSIQTAIDLANPGTTIFVLAGTYREYADGTNGLRITKDDIRLIGQSGPGKRVVLENAGNQRNGIVVVPENRTRCLDCHASMEPPFELHPDVPAPPGGLQMSEPMQRNVTVRGITIRNFVNNGLFTENVDGFTIDDVVSEGNKNYGIFPTLSRNGVIRNSTASGSDDSGIWVETSENVRVESNLVYDNVNGFEVSNSDDVTLTGNEARNNSVGAAILLLPDIFDDRPGAKRIHLTGNWFHDNDRQNTARPGSILSQVPPGIGILYLGVDHSKIEGNLVQDNPFVGIATVDYCLGASGTDYDCETDPTITPEFLADQTASNNRIFANVLQRNGGDPGSPADNPFFFAASDLALLTQGDHGNCFQNNTFTTKFSLLFGFLPPC